MSYPPEYWDWGHWVRQAFNREPFVIGQDDPYLLRWFLIPRNPYLNVYLHKFLRSDDDRALHDHPWWFLSLLLKGGYIEHRDDGSVVRRKRGSVAVRRANMLHRVELVHGYKSVWDAANGVQPSELPAWTLFFTGPKVREWGFKCPKGWLHWKEFDKRNGCGEFA